MENKKLKGIILAVITFLIAIFAVPSMAKAAELNPKLYLGLKEVRSNSQPEANLAFAINDPKTGIGDSLANKQGSIIWQIVSYNSIAKDGLNNNANFYCVKADVGFSNGTEQSTTVEDRIKEYDVKYDFVKERADMIARSGDTNLQSIVAQSHDQVYYSIMALCDLIYVKGSLGAEGKPVATGGSTDTEKQKLLNDANIYSLSDSDQNYLSDSMIDAIQQAAFWYFTQYDSPAYQNVYNNYSEDVDGSWFDFSNNSGVSYSAIADYLKKHDGSQGTQDDGEIRSKQVNALYNYLVETAQARWQDYRDGRRTPKSQITLLTCSGDMSAQPVIIVTPSHVFDLALRKYITDIDNQGVPNTRTPQIDGSKIAQKGTADYKHRKEPVTVKKGSIVTYKITIYNEGDANGIATEIIDKLPDGLEYYAEGGVTCSTGGVTYTASSEGGQIKFTRQSESTPLAAYAGGNNISSETITFKCKVTKSPSKTDTTILTNVAWISKEKNTETGNEITRTGDDRDSLPSTVPDTSDLPNYRGTDKSTDLSTSTHYFPGQEDDDDFEKLQLLPYNFDLALRKYITKVESAGRTTVLTGTAAKREPTIDGTKIATNGTADYKHRKDPVLVEQNDVVTYNITIYNEGDRAGVAKEIIDKLPTGLQFKELSAASKAKWTADSTTLSGENKVKFTRNSESDPLAAYSGSGVPASETIEFTCTVTQKEDEERELVLTNVAWISQEKNTADGITVLNPGEDTDSLPSTEPTIGTQETYNGHSSNPGDNNNATELGNPDTYFKGFEDDDDFEKLKLQPKQFDLRLKKTIFAVNGEEVPERILGVNVDELKAGATDAKFNMNKVPVLVKKGDIVKYRLRVYNEGDLAGYAAQVTEDVPDGLEFVYKYGVTNDDIEKDTTLSEVEQEAILWNQLHWDISKTDETTQKITEITTDDLAKGEGAEKGQPQSTANLLKPFDKTKDYLDTETEKNPDYRDLYIYMRVVSENSRKTTIRNEAAITMDKDENNEDIDDRDSQPENWEGKKDPSKYQDDEDYDLIKVQEFDLALRKFIIAVSEDDKIEESEELRDTVDNSKYAREPKVDTSKLNTEQDGQYVTTATYEHTKEPLLVNSNDYIVYMLRVYNEGDLAGYASEITDYLPDGLDYVDSEYNRQYNWQYDPVTRKISTDYLKNHLINAPTLNNGLKLDYAEVPIMCRLNDTVEPDVIQTNIAEITEDKDEHGEEIDDRDSTPDDLQEPEEKDKPNYNTWQEDDDDFEKVVIKKEPDIHKGVKDVENQDSGYDADESHTWVIESDIPEDIADYEIYNIIDDIDYRLEFTGIKDVKVSIVDNKTEVAELQEETDYIITFEENANGVSQKTSSGTLKLTFTDVEGEKTTLSDTILNNAGKKIRVEFNTTFAKDADGNILAELGEQVPNQAELEFKNKSTNKRKKRTEVPEVHTGGVTIFKYYNSDNKRVGLEGAEFTVYASKEDAEKNENAILTETSDKDGIIRIKGLQYGGDAYTSEENRKDDGTYDYDADNVSTSYWIVETKIPDGYDGITEPIEVKINKNSYQEEISSIQNQVENIPQIFDLALRKWVTQAIVIENGKQTVTQTGHTPEMDPEPIVKVDLNRKNLANVTVKFRYSIRITNQGHIAGYAKEITDYIPEGLQFIAAENPGWTEKGDNVITTNLLADRLLQPGESADVEVLLTWIKREDNMGLKTNTAEISEDYNDKGIPDIDSTPNNKKPKEDDIDDAPVMLSVKTGHAQVYYVLGVSVLSTLAAGVALIRKFVI